MSVQTRQVVVSVLLPLLIATTHRFVLRWFTETGGRADWQVAICFLLFVLQVGVAGAVAGRFLPGMLGWIVFGWTLLVIDLLTFCMAVAQSGSWVESGKMLATAIVSGQVGAVLVWGVLGEQRWAIRMPVAGAVALSMLFVWRLVLTGLSYFSTWFSLLVLQSLLLVVISLLLLRKAYRLTRTTENSSEIPSTSTKWRFNLKDIFVTTTAIAMVMAVFRATNIWANPYTRQFSPVGFAVEVLLAGLLAIVMTEAIRTVFGNRRWQVRFVRLISISFGIGGLIAISFQQMETWIYRNYTGRWVWLDMMWYLRLSWWWLPWVCLATGFLAATLWIFREKGYRLQIANTRVIH